MFDFIFSGGKPAQPRQRIALRDVTTIAGMPVNWKEAASAITYMVTVLEHAAGWPKEDCDKYRALLFDTLGWIPSIEEVFAEYGDQAIMYSTKVLEEQAKQIRRAKLVGALSAGEISMVDDQSLSWRVADCHICGNAFAQKPTYTADFGLRRGNQIKRCRLVFCGTCYGHRRNPHSSQAEVNQRDCSNHPSWLRLQQAGFTEFVPTDKLPP